MTIRPLFDRIEESQITARPFFRKELRAQAEPVVPETETAEPDTEVLVADEPEERTDEPWRVILYNDEIHAFDEVIRQLKKATGCSTGQAEDWAWEVHTKGKANVYEGSFEDCFQVQGVLREIQLVTEIEG